MVAMLVRDEVAVDVAMHECEMRAVDLQDRNALAMELRRV